MDDSSWDSEPPRIDPIDWRQMAIERIARRAYNEEISSVDSANRYADFRYILATELGPGFEEDIERADRAREERERMEREREEREREQRECEKHEREARDREAREREEQQERVRQEQERVEKDRLKRIQSMASRGYEIWRYELRDFAEQLAPRSPLPTPKPARRGASRFQGRLHSTPPVLR